MTPENIATLAAILVPVAALIAWAMRATIAPLRVVIENNTKALDRVVAVLDKHEEQIEDHEARLGTVEAVHRIRGCNEADR